MNPFNRTATLKPHQLIASLLVIVLLACSGFGQGRTKIEISSMIQPSADAGKYFSGHGRLGGGVVPRGSAVFLGPKNSVVSAKELQLVILDEAKFRNRRTDFGTIGIRWKDEVYELSVPDDLIYPLMKFIQRGSYIVYTVPVAGFDKKYFADNDLRPYRNVPDLGRGYVAKEFLGTPYAALLEATDFADVMPMSEKLQNGILSKVPAGYGEFTGVGSYVNADFHVRYKAFLQIDHGKRVVNVGGLPLRYHWRAATKGRAVQVYRIEVFRFPREPFARQDLSVMFFQTTAILRQFYNANRPEFNRFLREVQSLV